MKAAGTPYSADWLAISMRWLFLFAWVVERAPDSPLAGNAWPALALLVWNMAMTGFAVANARLSLHRWLNSVVDILMVGALLWLQGDVRSQALWVCLLPILTGAVYFEIYGALAASGIVAAVVLLGAWLGLYRIPADAIAWMGAAVAAGGVLGGAVTLLLRAIRARRRAWVVTGEARHQEETRRLRAIYDLTSTLTATLSYQRVLDSALDLGYTALNPEQGSASAEPLVAAVLLFRRDQLEVGASRRLTGADMRAVFAAAEGILRRLVEEGEPVHSTVVNRDPELSRVIAIRSCRSAYCCPLRTGFNVYGVLLFAHPLVDYFTPVRRDVLDIISRQAAIAVQNARLYRDLMEEKERLVEVHEEARKKLARDLHDGPTQSVAAMAMRISMARRLLESDPGAAGDELLRIADLADRAAREIRHTLFTLRPLILESQGLGAAVRTIADKMRETFNQRVLVEIDEQVELAIEPGKQALLFYMAEEAMSNARKHANATNIWVRLLPYRPGVALLEVADDGIGFDVKAVANLYDKRASLGLMNLRERAQLLDAVLEIQSKIGGGTRISVYVPLTREAADRLQQAERKAR